MSCLEIEPDKDKPDWSMLTDNRDFKAVPSWDPVDRAVNDDMISESFLLEQKYLKYRSFAMKSLATAVYMSEDIHPSRLAASNIAMKKENVVSNANNTANDVVTQTFSDSERSSLLFPVLESLIESLESHHQEVNKDLVNVDVLNKLAFGPDTARLALYAKSSHVDLLVDLSKLTLNVYKLVTKKDPLEQEKIKQLFESLSKNAASKFKSIVSDLEDFLNQNQDRLYQRCDKFESIINAAESASFAAILCGVCQAFLKSGNKFLLQSMQNNLVKDSQSVGKQSSSKGNKKKGSKDTAASTTDSRKDLHEFLPVFNEMIESFSVNISSLVALVENFEKAVAKDQLNALQNKFSSFKLANENEIIDNRTDNESAIKTNSQEGVHNKITNLNDNHNGESLDSIQSDILKQMESSYGISFLQIKTVIQNKQNYFSLLKCDISSTSQVKK